MNETMNHEGDEYAGNKPGIDSPCDDCFSRSMRPECQKGCPAFQYHSNGRQGQNGTKVLVSLMHQEEDFEVSFKAVQECVHQTTTSRGQWRDKSAGDVLSHIHSEVSELWREFQSPPGNKRSSVIPEFTKREEEAADIILMVMSLAEEAMMNVSGALIAKAKYNMVRDDRDGYPPAFSHADRVPMPSDRKIMRDRR